MPNNFYFLPSLVLSKDKFKIICFSKLFKLQQKALKITTFRHSLARTSAFLTSNFNVRTTTFKKIRIKYLLKKLLDNFFTCQTWCSFYDEASLGGFVKISSKLQKQFSNNLTIISTNKQVNKILNSVLISEYKIRKSHFFFEKYFNKEKYTHAIMLSNTLWVHFIWFFSFFVPNLYSHKSLFLSVENVFGLLKIRNIQGLFTATNIFTNKRIFVFFKNIFSVTNLVFSLNEIITLLNISDLIIFFWGKIYTQASELVFINTFKSKTSTFLDSTYIDFFKKKLFCNAIELPKSIKVENHFDIFHSMSNLFYLLKNNLIKNYILFFNLINVLKKIIQFHNTPVIAMLKKKIYIFFYLCQLFNN